MGSLHHIVNQRGKVLWRQKLPAQSFTPPLVAGQRVFVLMADRSVMGLDGATGELVLEPGPADLKRYHRRAAEIGKEQAQLTRLRRQPIPFDREAGADIRANLRPEDRASGFTLDPMHRAIVPTGLRVEIPLGYEMQIRPRSGLALKHGITLPNTPGTIDSDYRGPLGVALVNLGTVPYVVRHGDRIAQAVIAPVVQARFVVAETLSQTARGEGGFGSTGRG